MVWQAWRGYSIYVQKIYRQIGERWILSRTKRQAAKVNRNSFQKHGFYMSRTPTISTENWKFIGSCLDGQPFEIGGLNVWECEWKSMNLPNAMVIDPQYHHSYEFSIYQIKHDGKTIIFAAGEFSNCFWGFYIPELSKI